jgi:hypothetical protein
MTTLTYFNRVLAADSCYTIGNRREFGSKIRVFDLDAFHRLVIATSGDDADGVMLESMIYGRFITARYSEAGESDDLLAVVRKWDYIGLQDPPRELEENKPNADDDEMSCGIFFLQNIKNGEHIAWSFTDYRVIRRIVPGTYVAVGADALGALVAMDLGCDAVEAVFAACKRGTYSAPPVRYIGERVVQVPVDDVETYRKGKGASSAVAG